MQTHYLTPKAVCALLQCGRSTLTYWRKTDPDFPQPIYLGERSPRFVKTEMEAFMQARKQRRQQAH